MQRVVSAPSLINHCLLNPLSPDFVISVVFDLIRRLSKELCQILDPGASNMNDTIKETEINLTIVTLNFVPFVEWLKSHGACFIANAPRLVE